MLLGLKRISCCAPYLSCRRSDGFIRGFSTATTTSVGNNNNNTPKSPISWNSLFLASGLGLFAVGYFLNEEEKAKQRAISKNTKTIGKPLLGGAFELMDVKTKKAVTNLTLSNDNTFSLLYFGFTNCPDICPSEMLKMKQVVENLDAKQIKINPVFITIDKKRDTDEVISKYVSSYHPRTIGLNGTNEQLEDICKKFRVYYSKNEPDEENYLIDHSIIMYLIGPPNGEFYEFFTSMSDAKEVTARIEEKVKEYNNK